MRALCTSLVVALLLFVLPARAANDTMHPGFQDHPVLETPYTAPVRDPNTKETAGHVAAVGCQGVTAAVMVAYGAWFWLPVPMFIGYFLWNAGPDPKGAEQDWTGAAFTCFGVLAPIYLI